MVRTTFYLHFITAAGTTMIHPTSFKTLDAAMDYAEVPLLYGARDAWVVDNGGKTQADLGAIRKYLAKA
jgi:hypothetical protein